MEIDKELKNKIYKLYNKIIFCPTCKKKSTELFIPFCSKKCSDLDLMKWLSDDEFIGVESK
tara:strand:+ start:135 stop:317 length:183 start_codon:yes stop_codon:yes gene_type:complete